ncbi:MAG TPA: Imm70 family immunity protein [Gaiellaceae bacterium]|nr:Imm70 family immunity protein [Gaiellaceae bacterium]
MGLYLCIFASTLDDEEVDGVEVGGYDDFHLLRTTIAERLEGERWGSRFPVLMSHPDSDGEWSPEEAVALGEELAMIESELAALPPADHSEGSWQREVARQLGLKPSSLAESFIDVDGELLVARLRELARLAVERERPISFQ